MELIDVFVETIEDLRARCDLRASEYDMVQAAGLIRRLLIDKTPLWSQVNRDIRSSLAFEWMTVHKMAAGSIDEQVMTPGLVLDPVLFRALIQIRIADPGVRNELLNMKPRTGNVEQFLKSPVIDARKENGMVEVTVRELIKHYANREGGVHYGAGKSENATLEKARTFADEDLRYTILACGRIVYRTLEPLAAAALLRDVPWPRGLA
ncbi:hypothetical protein [Rhodococcus sp. (in: high G+C Gram-positive bacteria)]|uniref:hypothetical protein n=2 Tax=Rhodococcus sp. TaxID=1831 RepID=UPI003315018D